MVMTSPIISIIANGNDITEKLKDRISRLVVSFEKSNESDTVTFDIDDSNQNINAIARGAKLSVKLGYKETGLVSVGEFKVDEVRYTGPPHKISVTARSSDIGEALKEKKTVSFPDKTLGQIIDIVASNHELKAEYPKEVNSLEVVHVDQRGQSDADFLRVLASYHGYGLKITRERVVLFNKGAGRKTTGVNTMTIGLKPENINRYSMLDDSKEKYNGVIVTYHDTVKAELQKITMGSKPFFLVDRMPTKAIAEARAKTEMEKVNNHKMKASITIIGDPKINLGVRINVIGLRKPLNGSWVVEKATHNIARAGFTTSLELVAA